MKTELAKIRVFEPGDRVRTGEGVGTVISDNFHEIGENFYNDLKSNHEVAVQHDEGYSANPSNKPVEIEAELLGLLKPGDEGFDLMSIRGKFYR